MDLFKMYQSYLTGDNAAPNSVYSEELLYKFAGTLRSKVEICNLGRGSIPRVKSYPPPTEVWVADGNVHYQQVEARNENYCYPTEHYFLSRGDTLEDAVVSYLETLRGIIDGKTNIEVEMSYFRWKLLVKQYPTFGQVPAWHHGHMLGRDTNLLVKSENAGKWYGESVMTLLRYDLAYGLDNHDVVPLNAPL